MKTRQKAPARFFSMLLATIMLASLIVLPVNAAPPSGGEERFQSVGASSYGTTYYVDAEDGSDTNSGKSHTQAWKSLNKVTATTFLPGDHILLRTGSVWNGQMLYPKGSGSVGNPIVVDLYSLSADGKPVYGGDSRPIINGNGTEGIGTKKTIISGAVMIYNQEYWEFRNLEVTNSENLTDLDAYKKQGETQRAGILAYSDNQTKVYNHVVIKDCYVHDIQSEYYQKPKDSSVGGLKAVGGIIILGHHLDPNGNLVTASNGKSKAAFNNVLIEGNIVQRAGLEGIRTKCNSNTSLSGNTFFKTFTNIVIRNNYLEDIAGDGIVLTEVISGGVVENNISKQACNADYGTHNYAGIWSMYSNDALFQYNEVYGIVYGYNDGEAFDIDMSCDKNVYQYNYSHHNTGGFFLFMGDQLNSIVRYNVSANDGAGNKGTGKDGGAGNSYTYKQQSIFHYWNKVENANMPYIYNNTFYVGDGISTSLYGEGNSSNNSGTRARFYNNILYKEGEGTLMLLSNQPNNGSNPTERALGADPAHFMRNNIIWPASVVSTTSGATPEILETSGNIFANPLLVINESSENVAAFAAQKDTTFNTANGNIYEYTSADALRARAGLFKLQADSPALAAGTVVPGTPDEDLFGNPTTGRLPDIGAHQLSNIPFKTEVKEVPEVTISTMAGIYPSLPRALNITFIDISGASQTERTESRNVLWEAIPLSKYTTAGTFDITGTVDGIAQTAKATITVTGAVGEGDFEQIFAATQDSFIQRDKPTDPVGNVKGSVGNFGGDAAEKYPLRATFNNNLNLRIKSATAAAYNRRFIIEFNIDDFDGDWTSVKNASIRLHISRYDAWSGAGSNIQQRLLNTAFTLDVYATETGWTEETVAWGNAPLNADVTQFNHVGIGTNNEQIPTYADLEPVAHKAYINKDIIANGDTIDIDVADYIRSLDATTEKVSFLVDIPMANMSNFDKDNSGFDAFSREGAAAAYAAYINDQLPEGIIVESENSLSPQLVISDVYESAIDPITLETKIGDTLSLPTTATLRYSNNTTRTVGVTWNSYDPSLLTQEGEFTVTGYSGVTHIPVTATITVTANHIKSFEALSPIDIEIGYARNELGLPTKATAKLDNDEIIEIAILSWDDSAPPYSPGNEPFTAGYDFTGVFELPAGITNPNDAKPSQKVITHPITLSVELDEASKTVTAGENAQFTATVACQPAQDDTWSQAIIWTILTADGNPVGEGIGIDSDGLVTVLTSAATGEYIITATSARNSTLIAASKLFVEQSGPVNTEALAKLIEHCGSLKPLNYTLDSWNVLEAKYLVAQDVLENDAATQIMVNNALAALQNALDALTRELDIMLAACKDMSNAEGTYIPAAWEIFQQAIASAEATAADTSATQEQLIVATRTLLAAKTQVMTQTAPSKIALKTMIDIVTATDISGCTPQSIAAVEAALAAAQAVMDDPNATAEGITTAYNALVAAFTARKDAADKTDLLALIEQARLLDEANYTPTSWQSFPASIAAAVAVYENAEASEAEVTAAYRALFTSVQSLVARANFTALQAAINAAEGILANAGKYAPASIAGLREATDAAATVNLDKNSTQTQVNEATVALTAKIAVVRLKANKSGLRSTFSAASAMNLSPFTAASADALRSAMAQAPATLEDENATQETVDALNSEIERLVTALQKTPVAPITPEPEVPVVPVVPTPEVPVAPVAPTPEVTAPNTTPPATGTARPNNNNTGTGGATLPPRDTTPLQPGVTVPTTPESTQKPVTSQPETVAPQETQNLPDANVPLVGNQPAETGVNPIMWFVMGIGSAILILGAGFALFLFLKRRKEQNNK